MTSAKQWYANRIICALVCYYGWGQQRIATEYYLDGGAADFLVVSDANYATEIEIKVTLADWNCDQKKDKFKRARQYVRRFYYAVPETLADKMPSWVPDDVGLLVVRCGGKSFDVVEVVREAKLRKAEKLTPAMIERIYRSSYYKFWMQRHGLLREAERKRRDALMVEE